MTNANYTAWKSSELVNKFLSNVRGAVPLASEQIDIMRRLILATGRPVKNFLDIGCGDGILGAAILELFPQAKGIMQDFSEPMLDAAREKLSDFAGNLEFVISDYADPGWVDGVSQLAPFDAIVSGFSIHHQPNNRKKEIYSEIYSLLAHGGIFINIEHVASPTPWIESLFENLLIDSIYEMHLSQGSSKTREKIAEEFVNRQDKAANILAPVDIQCQWLRESGYQNVDCFFKIFELAVFGGMKP